jgi:hypothetical protein
MLWCETGGREQQDLEALAVVVSQLAGRGHDACVHVRSLVPGLGRNAEFDFAPYLRDRDPSPGDRVVLIAAQRLDEQRLAALRRFAVPGGMPCTAFGSFSSRQQMIGTTAKLAYVFGREPLVVELPGGRDGGEIAPMLGVEVERDPAPLPRVLVVASPLGDAARGAALVALGVSPRFRALVLTDGKSKQEWTAARGASLAVYQFGEVLPLALARHVDVCASFLPLRRNARLQALAANLAASGVALLDCTPAHENARTSDAFVRAPVDFGGLAAFIGSEVLPNLPALGEHVRASAFAKRCREATLPGCEDEAPARPPRRPRPDPPAPVVFVPTNGVGLGHAQRCALIAAEFRRGAPVTFAAFPSCARLIKGYGFDVVPLVPRSTLHAQKHANDVVNYLRLGAVGEGAAGLVFDGGYVFDSVYRTVMERGLRGVWVRRGLWQAGQNNTLSLDREKAFARVLVPQEAFAELNHAYSSGPQVRSVAPIVQRVALQAPERQALRARLAERYDVAFDDLVVTQLGGGVAADRRDQIQALCGMMERRARTLHLVVVWPTAAVQPGWFGWTRTRVVRTHHAAVLAAAADLAIGAAGYNAFHEMLYNAVPTIFMPQTGAFMDDQAARAGAAVERGLARSVEAHQLMTLERELGRMLDDGGAPELRQRLRLLDLLPPGNAEAASLIEEVIHGPTALERGAVARRPA